MMPPAPWWALPPRQTGKAAIEEAQRQDDSVHRRHAEAGLLLGDLEAPQVIDARRVGRPTEKRLVQQCLPLFALEMGASRLQSVG